MTYLAQINTVGGQNIPLHAYAIEQPKRSVSLDRFLKQAALQSGKQTDFLLCLLVFILDFYSRGFESCQKGKVGFLILRKSTSKKQPDKTETLDIISYPLSVRASESAIA